GVQTCALPILRYNLRAFTLNFFVYREAYMASDPANTDDYHLRFGGIERLYGRKALTAFRHAHIAIVGLGGVGSWAAEALARSGIGTITLRSEEHTSELQSRENLVCRL